MPHKNKSSTNGNNKKLAFILSNAACFHVKKTANDKSGKLKTQRGI